VGLRICSSKEEAIQAAEAGLLWYAWPPAAFAVLVEGDDGGDSPTASVECDSTTANEVSKD